MEKYLYEDLEKARVKVCETLGNDAILNTFYSAGSQPFMLVSYIDITDTAAVTHGEVKNGIGGVSLEEIVASRTRLALERIKTMIEESLQKLDKYEFRETLTQN